MAEQTLDVGAHQLRNIGCLADVAVCYPDLGRAGERELDSNRPRSASSPQDEGALARWVGNGTQRGQEALTVGVCPDPSAVASDGAIHRTDEPGRIGGSSIVR